MVIVSTMGLWGRGGCLSRGRGRGFRRAEVWNENGVRDRERERRKEYR